MSRTTDAWCDAHAAGAFEELFEDDAEGPPLSIRDCARCQSTHIINGSGKLHCDACGFVTTKESEARA